MVSPYAGQALTTWWSLYPTSLDTVIGMSWHHPEATSLGYYDWDNLGCVTVRWWFRRSLVKGNDWVSCKTYAGVDRPFSQRLLTGEIPSRLEAVHAR